MEDKNKTRLVFMTLFAILAFFDMISTYFALSVGANESNIIGSVFLELGMIGYLFFYIYLLSLAALVLLAIEIVVWMNGPMIKTKLPLGSYSFLCTMCSLFITLLQIAAIINNFTVYLT